MSDKPPKTQDDIPDEVFLKLGLLQDMERAKRNNPFYELERQICQLRTEYMFKNRNPPTRVLMGLNQYRALDHKPLEHLHTFQVGSFADMEIIRVLKDDFLEVL